MARTAFNDEVLDGRFEFIAELGRGGMGTVYKACERTTERVVSVKVMRLEMRVDESNSKRFEREAKTLERLRHPLIVSAYSFDLDSWGNPFFVMDYLDGRNLDEEIGLSVISPTRFFDIFVQAASALAYAHGEGVIHRDLKPSNVFLCTDGTVRILDFGLAKVASELNDNLTQAGELLGSPPYMAPEQFDGRELDVRSDIYSLGCVMFEALVGAPPYLCDNLPAYAMKHLQAKVPDLTASADRPPIPAGIQALVKAMLAKEPRDRPCSMDEVLNLLNALSLNPDATPSPLLVAAQSGRHRSALTSNPGGKDSSGALSFLRKLINGADKRSNSVK